MKGCMSCSFWSRLEDQQDNVDRGICRRFPPVIVPYYINPLGGTKSSNKDVKIIDHAIEFPETLQEDWCGEYRKKSSTFETKNG
jgi:hypothetical protein